MDNKSLSPLERLRKAISDSGCHWTDEMLSAFQEAHEAMSTPMNGDQVMKLWQQSNGHAMRFAALIESWHGMVPSIFGEKKDV